MIIKTEPWNHWVWDTQEVFQWSKGRQNKIWSMIWTLGKIIIVVLKYRFWLYFAQLGSLSSVKSPWMWNLKWAFVQKQLEKISGSSNLKMAGLNLDCYLSSKFFLACLPPLFLQYFLSSLSIVYPWGPTLCSYVGSFLPGGETAKNKTIHLSLLLHIVH